MRRPPVALSTAVWPLWHAPQPSPSAPRALPSTATPSTSVKPGISTTKGHSSRDSKSTVSTRTPGPSNSKYRASNVNSRFQTSRDHSLHRIHRCVAATIAAVSVAGISSLAALVQTMSWNLTKSEFAMARHGVECLLASWALVSLEISLFLHVAQSSTLGLRKNCSDQAWFDGTEPGNSISLGQQRLRHQSTCCCVEVFLVYSFW